MKLDAMNDEFYGKMMQKPYLQWHDKDANMK